MARFFTGREGQVTVGGTAINVTGWSITESAPAIDVSHTGSSGKRVNIADISSITGSFTLNTDADVNHFDTYSLYAGQSVALKLYRENSSGTFWDLPTARITENSENSEVASSPVNQSFSFEVTGTYTRPSGTM